MRRPPHSVFCYASGRMFSFFGIFISFAPKERNAVKKILRSKKIWQRLNEFDEVDGGFLRE